MHFLKISQIKPSNIISGELVSHIHNKPARFYFRQKVFCQIIRRLRNLRRMINEFVHLKLLKAVILNLQQRTLLLIEQKALFRRQQSEIINNCCYFSLNKRHWQFFLLGWQFFFFVWLHSAFWDFYVCDFFLLLFWRLFFFFLLVYAGEEEVIVFLFFGF